MPLTLTDVKKCVARVILDNYQKFEHMYEHETGALEVWFQAELYYVMRGLDGNVCREASYTRNSGKRVDIKHTDTTGNSTLIELKLRRSVDWERSDVDDITKLEAYMGYDETGFAVVVSFNVALSTFIRGHKFFVIGDGYHPIAGTSWDVPDANIREPLPQERGIPMPYFAIIIEQAGMLC